MDTMKLARRILGGACLGLCAAAWFAAAPGSALAVSLSEKAKLQAAMSRHVERQTIDGVYLDLDGATGAVRRLHPVTAHPMILRMGKNYVLCYDFRDGAGKDVPIDFYLAGKGDGYTVFHASVHNRQLLERLMKAGKVKRAD